MSKDGGQVDQKNSVYNDAVNDEKIEDVNKDGLHLYNGLGDNISNSSNKYNYIKQRGNINQQDG